MPFRGLGRRRKESLSDFHLFLMRMHGILRKEMLQIRRDPSSIALALVMPVNNKVEGAVAGLIK